MIKTDVLIIGSGIGGLTTAIKIAEKMPELKITILTKTNEEESNTRYAQGGVAAVWNKEEDSYQKHLEDTLDAGDGLCNEDIVNIVVNEGPERVQEIIDWGARFDKNAAEKYDLGREGGHSENRILHYKDLTGWEIQRTLLAKAEVLNLDIQEHYFAVDLITQHHLGYNITRLTPGITCYGAHVLNKHTGKMETILSRMTILATGGAGQVYRNTTNPVIASGDGISMLYRAKGHIENMEFIQFHPTALFNPAGENPVFLVSEAVRGYGGILKTRDGKEFMEKYDPRKSLAPRDIVARAIDNEMKLNGEECMFLDCRHLDKEGFLAHFPTIYEKCKSIGVDPMEDMIPVVPACHYVCGGIKVDDIGRSSLYNLYACGECTCTGLHGANRLASNSLLEALVFADRIAQDVVQNLSGVLFAEGIPEWNATSTTDPKEMVLITQSLKELKEIMSSYVGIVRSNVRLKRALDRMFLLYNETEGLYNTTTISPQLCELRNLITIGYLITRSASMRHESRGLHYTTDYPVKKPFIQDSIL
ncbi:MAG: L-aspartate oxidase [Saprospiraceae bacterium]|nr:MAG: L-aspartate oxidase [Saprospiraceae bacterium]